MGSDLNITKHLQDYILKNGLKLHPIQKEIIDYNLSLGDIKRMQISISQCQFLHLIIKISKITRVLEIGTFTGLSTLSMALALPDEGSIIALDKNEETNKIAQNFFKKAYQDHKIKTIIKPALESLMSIRNEKFDLVFIDADKMNYQKYYEISLDLLNKEGLVIIDKDNEGNVVRKCQLCSSGTLSLKNSFRGGAFIGCSNYPECKFTRPLSKAKAAAQAQLAEPKFIGKHLNGNDIHLKNGRFGPYLQYEQIPSDIEVKKISKKKKKTKKLKSDFNELLKNVSIPKGLELESINLEKAQFLCSLPKSLGINPDNQKEITVNVGRFGPYLKCENKSARIDNVEEIFSIGLNRAITLIAEAKPGRMSSSIIKDLGEHPEDKKPVRVMKGQYGPYIKYKSLNATIPEEKDPTELTMEEALILIEKRKEYDKSKKSKSKKKK